jgi:Tfp pilus assembly protein FimV
LYSSHLSNWRRQREQALTAPRRGRKVSVKTAQAERLAQLERDKERLQAQLEQARTIIEVQKKLSERLGLPASGSGKA